MTPLPQSPSAPISLKRAAHTSIIPDSQTIRSPTSPAHQILLSKPESGDTTTLQRRHLHRPPLSRKRRQSRPAPHFLNLHISQTLHSFLTSESSQTLLFFRLSLHLCTGLLLRQFLPSLSDKPALPRVLLLSSEKSALLLSFGVLLKTILQLTLPCFFFRLCLTLLFGFSLLLCKLLTLLCILFCSQLSLFTSASSLFCSSLQGLFLTKTLRDLCLFPTPSFELSQRLLLLQALLLLLGLQARGQQAPPISVL